MNIPTGRYVVAVSGGVDSIALLHMLAAQPEIKLTVAHFDHGIRVDSLIDRKLVQLTAKEYGLPFVYKTAKLGANASEATARAARYDFLHAVRKASGASAIITAHHQDDLLETALLNLMRGTGRRGLSSLKSTDTVMRPLLHMSKPAIEQYARDNQLVWREDSTNADERYTRNYIRHRIIPRFNTAERTKMLTLLQKAHVHNQQLSIELAHYLHLQPSTHTLDRHDFILLPHAVAREVLAEWLLLRTSTEISRKLLERLVIAAKTGKIGTKVDIDKHYWLEIGRSTLALSKRER